VKPKIQILSH